MGANSRQVVLRVAALLALTVSFSSLTLVAAACGSGSPPARPPGEGGVGTSDASSDSVAGEGSSRDDAGLTPPTRFRVALSPSPFAELLLTHGVGYSDGVRTANDLGSLAALFAAHGASEVYARIATRKTQLPGSGAPDPSMVTGLARAKVAAASGLPYNPELGLFRTYGDVSCQTPPDLSEWGISLSGPWQTLGVDAMATELRAYTVAAASAILATGVRVEVWDVGNEVDFGTAGVAPAPLQGSSCDQAEGAPGWYRAPNAVDLAIGMQSVQSLLQMPEASRIAWLQTHLWPYEAKLLGAAAAGIRSVAPGAAIETHISNSASPTFAVAFYQAMKDGGVGLDVAGFSFYPTSAPAPNTRLKDLADTVNAVRAQLGMPSFLAEVGYPAALLSGTSYFSTWNDALASYPLTEAGQRDLFHDLASWGASGALTGIRPWGPDIFISDWAPMSFFSLPDGSVVGQGRAVLDAIAKGAATPNASALKY